MKLKQSLSPLAFILLVSVFWAGCKTNFYAPPPNYDSSVPVYTPKPSFVQVPISIPFSLINQELNKQLSGLIYDDQDFNGPGSKDNLKISVYRTKKEIKVDGKLNKLRFQVPLEIFATYRLQPCSFCPDVIQSTSFELDLTLVSSLEVGADWKLKASTTASDFTFPKKPMLDIGLTEVDITSLVKSALKENIFEITYAIDEQVADALPVKDYMTDAWNSVQDPLLVDSVFQTWLVFRPNTFMMQPLYCTSTDAVLNAGLETYIETKLGEKPVVSKKVALGSPFVQQKMDSKFSIELPVTIDFGFATELARKNLKDSTFTISKRKKVTIDDIEIYGKGGDVFIKATLSGSLEGVVYLKGQPAIDSLTQNIYFANLDFDINTKNGLLKVADWLAHGTLRKIFQKNFVYNVKSDLDLAKTTIQEFLDGYSYGKIFTVNGTIGDLNLKKIFANEQGITAVFYGDGNAALKITGFEY